MEFLKLCEDCGAEKERYENIAGVKKLRCPECEGNPRIKDIEYYRCYGCNVVSRDIVCHHTSYDPERVVPMCFDCHRRLHQESDFLPHLTPDMKRTEAMSSVGVSQIGIDDTEYEPVKIEKVALW